MKDEKKKYGITCKEALKAFSDLGETLRKEMILPEKPWPRPEAKPYWKILDINCLPDDFFKTEYEIQFKSDDDKWYSTDYFELEDRSHLIGVLMNLVFPYRYRPTTSKKTNEELAEEWCDYKISGPRPFWDEDRKMTYQIERGIGVNAFIAGRKSMESES